MRVRQAIGIFVACLATSACASGEAFEGKKFDDPGDATVISQENAEVPAANACNLIADASCNLVRALGIRLFGKAAWYNLVGSRTASGEFLDTATLTAAHRWLPLASFAKVTNLDNGRSVILKINDRGPYTRDRILDLSPGAADALDMKHVGVVAVVIEPLLTLVRTAESF